MDVTLQVIQIGGAVLTALVLGSLFSSVGLSSSLGYILAGILLGPLMLGYLTPLNEITSVFGEIGLLVLMFYLGLELSIKRFKERGAVATVVVMVEMLVSFAIGFGIAKFFGYGDLEALVIGSLLPMASTVIIAKFLLDKHILDSPEARISISSLIVEDFVAIVVLAVLSTLSKQGGSVNAVVFNGIFFVIAAFFVVNKLAAPVLDFLAARGQEDKMPLLAVGVGIVVAYLGSLLGLSTVLGAYFAGFALAETRYAERIKRELGFFREFFVLFFFVAFGAAAVFPANATVFLMLAAILPLYFVSKILVYGVFGAVFGESNDSAVTCGILMLPIGEFSLIIAAAASGVVSNPGEIIGLAFLLVLSTSLLAPLFYNNRSAIARLFANVYPRRIRDGLAVFSRRLFAAGGLATEALKDEHSAVIRKLFRNFVVIFAIVYISYLLDLQISFPFIPGPSSFSLGLGILFLIAWPAYDSLKQLVYLVRTLAERALKRAFPTLPSESFARQASEAFAALLILIISVLACFAVYYRAPPLFLVLPGAFALLSLLYLGKAFYALFDQFESFQEFGGPLAVQFEERAKRFRSLHQARAEATQDIEDALESGDVNRARLLLSSFKKREEGMLREMIPAKRGVKVEKGHTRRALAHYFHRNPPKLGKRAGRRAK